jgi:hypothetical protein
MIVILRLKLADTGSAPGLPQNRHPAEEYCHGGSKPGNRHAADQA